MESNKSDVKNEPTVGINFFENIPPVGTESRTSQRVHPVGLQNTTHGMSWQKQQDSNKDFDNPVVKGFGSTALFTFGVLATAKKSGYRIRFDDDTQKQMKLCNAEDICKRNYAIIKECYKENRSSVSYRLLNDYDNDDLETELQIGEDIFASDYNTKRKGWTKEAGRLSKGGKLEW
jgi:hypothetical protein